MEREIRRKIRLGLRGAGKVLRPLKKEKKKPYTKMVMGIIFASRKMVILVICFEICIVLTHLCVYFPQNI